MIERIAVICTFLFSSTSTIILVYALNKPYSEVIGRILKTLAILCTISGIVAIIATLSKIV